MFFNIRGVKRFYTHQVKAMDLVFNGSSIVAATPTASGKSMTYIVPVCLGLENPLPLSSVLITFQGRLEVVLEVLQECCLKGLKFCMLVWQVLNSLIKNSNSRALFIFPYKVLVLNSFT